LRKQPIDCGDSEVVSGSLQATLAQQVRGRATGNTITLIKRIHKEDPTLSPEKIRERLLDLNIADTPAANTIAKYIRDQRVPPTEKQKQSWQTFLRNHAKGIWAME